MSERFDLGIRKDTGRLGVLFSTTLVDFGFPKDQPDASEKAVRMAVIRDKAPEGEEVYPPPTTEEQAPDEKADD